MSAQPKDDLRSGPPDEFTLVGGPEPLPNFASRTPAQRPELTPEPPHNKATRLRRGRRQPRFSGGVYRTRSGLSAAGATDIGFGPVYVFQVKP